MDNPDRRKLCGECGAPLGAACPSCGFPNSPDSAFCHQCYLPLGGSALSLPAGEVPQPADPESFAKGRYQVLRYLSQAPGRRAYLAEDLDLDRRVVVTVITVTAPGDALQLYVKALARRMAKLSGHPNIAGIYDAGDEKGRAYIVSEYPAGSLEDSLRATERGGLALPEALRIGAEVSEALNYAHSLRVIHGALTTASVTLGPSGGVKVGDFGLGLPLAMHLSQLSGASVEVGLLDSVAPELLQGALPDARSDIYSLGALLYEMVAGRPPWADTGERVITQLEREALPLSKTAPDAPAALQTLVWSMLLRSPEERPQSAAVVLERLHDIGARLQSPRVSTRPAERALPRRLSAEATGAVDLPLPVAQRSTRRFPSFAPASQFAAVAAFLAVFAAGAALMFPRSAGRWPALLKLARNGLGLESVGASHPNLSASSGSSANRGLVARADGSLGPGRLRGAVGAEQPYQDLVQLARQGNADAATALGQMYLWGQGGAVDYDQALRWFHEGASRGDARAQLGLGYMYARGQGVPQDYAQAMRWFTQAADAGNADAQYDLAMVYQDGRGVAQDRAEALKWLRRAAAKDNARAQYELGRRYLAGDGLIQDYGRAFQWLHPAADQGNVAAQNALGYMYEQGDGVSQDYSSALHWYRKAAERDDAKAELNLGVMYEMGQGVAQSYSEAEAWYRKAAAQGEAYAQTSLGVLYCKGQGVERSYAQALDWFGKAAVQGEPKAQFNLGVMYDTGMGVKKDYAEAARWYRKAAVQGNIDAQYNLGYLYENGQGVGRDYAEATEWYRKAASRGDSSAQERLRVIESR